MSDPTPTPSPSDALEFLRSSLPLNPGLDGERDTAIRTLCELVDSLVGDMLEAADYMEKGDDPEDRMLVGVELRRRANLVKARLEASE